MISSYKKLCISIFSIFSFLISVNGVNAQMFWNQACSFNGTNTSYVAVRNSTSLNLTGSFTLEAWVNPSTLTGLSKGIMSKGGTLGSSLEYGIRLLSSGRFNVFTNGSSKLTSKTTTVLPVNAWSHICATYNSATNTFSLYFNGVLDTSSMVLGAAPPSNTDSLFIGISGTTTPFSGKLDEVRIWDRVLSSTEVYDYRRTSLGVNTGVYSGLIMSLTFQDNDANGSPFSMVDWSGTGNSGVARNASAFDLSNRPQETIQMNDCIELDGASDFLSAPDNVSTSPTEQLTLSAWIYLRAYTNAIIIHNGPVTGGAGTNYRLSIVSRKLSGGINGNFNFSTDDTIPLFRWTYVTFSYYAPLGSYQYHIDGELVYSGVNSLGNITNDSDSLFIGGSTALTNFNGYIDEVRIIPDVKFTQTLNELMFKSIELSNGTAGSYAVFNFDGYGMSNINTTPDMTFNGNARFAHSGSNDDQPQSPLNRADNINFQDGFYLKKSDRRIPQSGTAGSMIRDSLKILRTDVISDINVFIALNHTYEGELNIDLIAPNGESVRLFENNIMVLNSDNITTIFDDQADSSLVDSRYVSFSPRIKPFSNLNSIFGGDSCKGIWKLSIQDVNTADTGLLYGWGIQINNTAQKSFQLDVTNLIQGFYNPVTNLMTQDTARYYLRNIGNPLGLYDSAKVFLSNKGHANIYFTNVAAGVGYFLQFKHRNSIETYNYEAVYYDPLTFQSEYNFSTDIAKAYGSNQILIDNLPSVYAFYGGDVDQSGAVDGTDISLIDNDAYNFVTGYVNTDVTGDNVTDASDFALADNNAANFVTREVPPGAPENFNVTEIKTNEIFQDMNVDNSGIDYSGDTKYRERIIKVESKK